jgi:hypothetical protein
MLRSLVVLILGVNIALFFWIPSQSDLGEADREPAAPAAPGLARVIQVLPTCPRGAARLRPFRVRRRIDASRRRPPDCRRRRRRPAASAGSIARSRASAAPSRTPRPSADRAGATRGVARASR